MGGTEENNNKCQDNQSLDQDLNLESLKNDREPPTQYDVRFWPSSMQPTTSVPGLSGFLHNSLQCDQWHSQV